MTTPVGHDRLQWMQLFHTEYAASRHARLRWQQPRLWRGWCCSLLGGGGVNCGIQEKGRPCNWEKSEKPAVRSLPTQAESRQPGNCCVAATRRSQFPNRLSAFVQPTAAPITHPALHLNQVTYNNCNIHPPLPTLSGCVERCCFSILLICSIPYLLICSRPLTTCCNPCPIRAVIILSCGIISTEAPPPPTRTWQAQPIKGKATCTRRRQARQRECRRGLHLMGLRPKK